MGPVEHAHGRSVPSLRRWRRALGLEQHRQATLSRHGDAERQGAECGGSCSMNALCRACAMVLVAILSGCSPGAADWINDLKSTDVAVRRASAELLADTAPTTPEVVTALTGAIDDHDPEVRRWACRGLGRHQATEAVAKLEGRL